MADRKSADGAADNQAAVPGGQDLAPLSRRFGALMVDWFLSLFVTSLVTDPRRDWWVPVAVLVVAYALGCGLFGQTPGMRLFGVVCVSASTGGPIGLGRGLVRSLLMVLILPVLIMDEFYRGLHDKAADSVMLRA